MREIMMSIIEEAINEFERMNDMCAEFEREHPDTYAQIYQQSLMEF